jgi:hypothetical protein
VVIQVDLEDIELAQPGSRQCVRCGAASACTCSDLRGGDRDWTCPQHGIETDFDPDDQDAVTDPLCAWCFAEIDMCDDWCAEHAQDCDGYCDHATPSHMNECTDARQDARIWRERRESR